MLMRVLHRSMLRDLVVAFTMTLVVITFVMSLGVLLKAIDLVADGVPLAAIGKIFFYNLPYLLTFTIPMSVLTAVLLTFNRLSMDGELTAMRAGGLSLFQICSPVLVFAMLMTGVCFWVNNEASPRSHFSRREIFNDLGQLDPLDFLQEGQFNNDFPGLSIFIGSKKGKDLEDVEIFERKKSKVVRIIRAKTGEVQQDKEAQTMKVVLFDVFIDQPDPEDTGQGRNFKAKRWEFPLDLKTRLSNSKLRKARKDQTFSELNASIREPWKFRPELDDEKLNVESRKNMVEASKRISLAMSCFSFALIGIPLGIKSKRKENSGGIGVGLAVVGLCYFFIVLAENLVKYPAFLPDVLIWTPVILTQVIAVVMLRRIR